MDEKNEQLTCYFNEAGRADHQAQEPLRATDPLDKVKKVAIEAARISKSLSQKP